MSAADRCGGALVVAIVAALIGCGGSDELEDGGVVIDAGGMDAARPDDGSRDAAPGCSDPVAAGQYTVTVLPFLVGPHYSFRFELAADGTFAGHMYEGTPDGPTRCDGTVTPEESERLTAAINEGQFFCRGDSIYDPTAPDASQEDFELRTTDGLRANRFCGQGALGDDALAALNGAIGVIVGRVYTSGGCMGELYEVPTRTEQCPPW